MKLVYAVCAFLISSDAQARPLPAFKDIQYKVMASTSARLDVYYPEGPRKKLPVIIYYHGGGWYSGDKAQDYWVPYFKHFLDHGFAVVMVNYRLAGEAKAPAAVQDAKCAMLWTMAHKAQYGFGKVYLAGASAGGHLALMAGLADGMEEGCQWHPKDRQITSIINVSGIVSFDGLTRDLTSQWVKNYWKADGLVMQKLMSPIEWVKAGSPPIVSAHGILDPVVPFAYTVAFHKKLSAIGVRNVLIVKKAHHGDFNEKQSADIWIRTFAFIGVK